MGDYTIKDNLIYDTRTGTAYHSISDSEGPKKLFAVVVMGGHCGNGYFIPHMLNIAAASEQDAISSAMKVGRVKKNLKNKILACSQINDIEYRAIEHINDCDPYHYAEGSSTLVPDLEERRIVLEGVQDWRDFDDNKKRKRKASIFEVRTADMYDDKYVLQRYFAPYMYGDKLVYPKKVIFRDMLDEFLYYNTIEIGIKRGKIHSLSYYYQLYGENNNLGIRYNNGCLTYVNQYNEVIDVYVDKFMKEHLDFAKAKFEQKQQIQDDTIKDVKIESAKERYLKRFEKYLAMKKNKSVEEEDSSQR